VSTADTASASGFLLPLIIGLGSLGFIFSAVIALSPTAAEIVEENALMQRIGQSQMAQGQMAQGQMAQGQAARYESQARAGQGYGNGYPGGQGYSNGQPTGQAHQPGQEEPGSLFRPRRPGTPGGQP
jgi:hypothetical protein